jgi:UDP-N-acetylmuramoylalanine--D-glutamate ligase
MELKNKRVLVVGLGKSGLAAALFLRDRGARVTVSDTRSAASLAKEIPALLEAGIMVESGGHGLLTFRRQDLIVVSPGVPLETPEVAQARAFGLTVIGELELGYRFLAGSVLAITGSNGKTTTTTLAGKIFADAGLKTLVGGNIGLPVVDLVAQSLAPAPVPGEGLGGEAPIALAKDAGPGAENGDIHAVMVEGGHDPAQRSSASVWSVLEVSSFQLETTVEFRPKIAVVLNITPDHLDRHKTFERYADAKARITARQTAEDFLILNAEDKATQMLAARTHAQIFWFSNQRRIKRGAFVHGETLFFLGSEGGVPEPVLPLAEIPLRGAHNVENVLAAVCAARLAGISCASIRTSVAGFRAVEHRLELVRTLHGVEYYNDSKATNVDATLKALAAFPRGIHLILGGKDKDSDYTLLGPLVSERVARVYTIGSAAEKIERQLAGFVKIKPEPSGTLDRAVRAAAAAAVAGDVVLLAPACSSFDQFENYEHRGRAFREVVATL